MHVNCNWASPPSPLSLRRGGDKSPFLAHFQEISQARDWGEKGNFSPPLLKERGLGGEAQLQFIIIYFYTLQSTYNHDFFYFHFALRSPS